MNWETASTVISDGTGESNLLLYRYLAADPWVTPVLFADDRHVINSVVYQNNDDFCQAWCNDHHTYYYIWNELWTHSFLTFWFAGNGLAPTTNRYCDFYTTFMCNVVDEKYNLLCPKSKMYRGMYIFLYFLYSFDSCIKVTILVCVWCQAISPDQNVQYVYVHCTF